MFNPLVHVVITTVESIGNFFFFLSYMPFLLWTSLEPQPQSINQITTQEKDAKKDELINLVIINNQNTTYLAQRLSL